ncbi:ATP-binding protein [Desulfurivibrio sp. D14AmB]|uniref:ATP-binding protein n=1 Tax=Desulfurivibrio sp. D14AmB TaxID=3374370 RepID=UPI00376F338B
MTKLAPQKFILASPWIFTAAVAILLGIILVFAVDNMRREQRQATESLFNRGQAVIRLVEAGTRSTMMRMAFPDPLQFQHLLEQTGQEESILYIAVVDHRGLILAHSDPELVGTQLPFSLPGQEGFPAANGEPPFPSPAPAYRLLTETAFPARVFEVYAPFNPLARGRHWREQAELNQAQRPRMGHMGMGPMGSGGRLGQEGVGTEGIPAIFARGELRLILVGLDMKAEEAVINRNRRHIFFISLALLLAGIGGWTALLAIQGYRKEMEREVQKHEHLVALGKMAAGVAHEVRNPLSSIKGLATLLGNRFPADDPDRDTARLLVSEVERLNRSIGELLDYARPLPLNRRPCDLNQLLQNSLKLVAADAKALKVELEFTAAPQLPTADLDPDRITQVLLNLYLNALQAMPQGGVLRVRAEATGGGAGRVRLVISDTGQGIAPADLPRITDPYFTTKPDGSGLGLAMVRKIIDEHGGQMTIASREHQGTTVTITL